MRDMFAGTRPPASVQTARRFEDDSAFVEALRRGDLGAAAELYRRHVKDVERIVMRVLGPDQECDDVVQEVFLGAMAGLQRFRGDATGLRFYMIQVAVNRARSLLRYRRARQWIRLGREREPLPEPRAHTAPAEAVHALRRAYALFDELSPQNRVVLVLRIVEGMDLADVARATGLSLATVKRRFNAAREHFFDLASEDSILRDWMKEPHP